MSESDLAAEERRLGSRVHEHGGVWWTEARPLYYKPVFEFRAFTRGAARPALAKSLLGYSHQVPTAEEANRFVTYMVLEGEELRCFGPESVRGAKRNKVKKGLSSCDIELISDLEPCLERMRAINIAQARRFEALGEHGSFLPSGYYEQHADRWRRETRRQFTHRGKRWWGAFRGGVLVAYLVSVEVGQVRMIGAVKSDPACLEARPVDALYFRVLEAAGRDIECLQVVNGGTRGERPSLTQFKEQFLFRKKEVPYFTANEVLHRLGKNAAAGITGALARLRIK